MKRTAFRAVAATLLLLVAKPLLAQDPEFSQFFANRLYLNPAYVGSERCPRVMLSYRNQWPGISGTYVTQHASYDQYVDAISGGIGVAVMHDVAGAGGILKTDWMSGMYAYKLNVNRFFTISAGFQVTYAQKSVDWSKLNFGDMIDPKRGFVYNTNELNYVEKRNYLDISAGLLGYGKHYYFGIAAHHLTEPDEALISGPSPLPMKITAHLGAMIPIDFDKDGKMSISPNILFQKQQDFQQINLGLYVKRGAIVTGLWYRNQDAFIILLGVETALFKIGYSYDLTISKLTNVTAGAHEISLMTSFACRVKKHRFRLEDCPSF